MTCGASLPPLLPFPFPYLVEAGTATGADGLKREAETNFSFPPSPPFFSPASAWARQGGEGAQAINLATLFFSFFFPSPGQLLTLNTKTISKIPPPPFPFFPLLFLPRAHWKNTMSPGQMQIPSLISISLLPPLPPQTEKQLQQTLSAQRPPPFPPHYPAVVFFSFFFEDSMKEH